MERIASYLISEGLRLARSLRQYIGSRSSFNVRTTRHAAERPVRSLNLEREIELHPSFTYHCDEREEKQANHKQNLED